MIVYLDRACIASSASSIIRDLNLSSTADLGPVYAAFALAYGLFEIPNGWLGDMFGPRRVLIRISIWWSIFVALTGVVGMTVGSHVLGGVTALVVLQFLAGMGEAGAFPNITRALYNWFPPEERGFAQGAVWMCGRLMGGLTPLVFTVLVTGISLAPLSSNGAAAHSQIVLPPLLSWRGVFWFCAAIGVVWCIVFAMCFRNRPHEGIRDWGLGIRAAGNSSPYPLIPNPRLHAAVPWLRFLGSSNLWLLCTMYGVQSYGWYFYITYLPKFFEQNLDVPASSLRGAVYKGGPLWMGAAGCLLGGFLTDFFIRRTGNLRWGRRFTGIVGHTSTALCFLACYMMCKPGGDPFAYFLAISMAGFSTDLAMGAAWASCQDIGKRYSAVVAGTMNMVGNLGGFLASEVYGYFLNRSLNAHAAALGCNVIALTDAQKSAGLWHGYATNFLIAVGMYTVGVLCWFRIDATRPIVEEE
jgi:MFS family permease